MKKRAESIESYNELLMKMTMQWAEWVFVVDADTKEIVYCNKDQEMNGDSDSNFCDICKNRITGRERIMEWEGNSREVWELDTEDGRILRINSYPVEWRGRSSYVHVAADITEEKMEEKRLSDKAYFDPGTGVYNRLFFEYIEKLLKEKVPVTLCYLDMDGLKYVNDHYGHLEGDRYIRAFVEEITRSFRKEDIFARIGGDEFCLILLNRLKEIAIRKLEKARTQFMEGKEEYPGSFSYGIYEIDGAQESLTLDDIICQADARMYEYKRKNKEKRE